MGESEKKKWNISNVFWLVSVIWYNLGIIFWFIVALCISIYDDVPFIPDSVVLGIMACIMIGCALYVINVLILLRLKRKTMKLNSLKELAILFVTAVPIYGAIFYQKVLRFGIKRWNRT